MRILEITIPQYELSSRAFSYLRRFFEYIVIFLLGGCTTSSSTLNHYENCFSAKYIKASILFSVPNNDTVNTDIYYFPLGNYMSESEIVKLRRGDYAGYILQGPSDEVSISVDLNSLIYFPGSVVINNSDWMKSQVGLKDKFYFVVYSEKGKYLLDYKIGWSITGIANASRLKCVN